MKPKTKQLRAVGYCRTSSESQRDNTSIPTQREAIERLITFNEWTFVRHYIDESKSGTKIAGRDAFQQMMRDAAAGHFDVVVPFDMSRFARDGLDIMNSARTLSHDFNVHVVDTKGSFDTRDRTRVLNNYVSAGVAEDERIRIKTRTFLGKKRMIEEHGAPRSFAKPFGRIWDKDSRTWKIDPEKHRMIKDCAKRYLAGEPLKKLAEEYGVNLPNLGKTLMWRCGDTWQQRLRCPELEIDEVVDTKIPRLLDEKTIKAIHELAAANRTYKRRGPKHHEHYLLSRFVFCAHCGKALSPQPSNREAGHFYYRHNVRAAAEKCPIRPRPYIRSAEIDELVIRELFEMFGNPHAVEKAIKAAFPNLEKRKEAEERLDRIAGELAKINEGRDRILGLIAKGTITEKQAERQLGSLQEREDHLHNEQEQIEASIADLPTPDSIRDMADRVHKRFAKKHGKKRGPLVSAEPMLVNMDFERMTIEDKRALLELVFSGKTADGRRHGVYVASIPGQAKNRHKKFSYEIVGHLIRSDDDYRVQGYLPMSEGRKRIMRGEGDIASEIAEHELHAKKSKKKKPARQNVQASRCVPLSFFGPECR